MEKTLGIICGSAAAVALLISVVGMPRIESMAGDEAADESALPVEVTQVREAEPATAAAADVLESDVVDVSMSEAPSTTTAAAEPIASAEPAAPAQQEGGESWYAFWSPFRTELAANGFVQRLQARTGLDYRVVRVDTGNYEVAFAYSDQTDIDQKLVAISAATGLELPGS